MCLYAIVAAVAVLAFTAPGAGARRGGQTPSRPESALAANSAVRHVGTAREAVVHVSVSLRDPATGRTEQREGSGVLIRCDGFVLLPTALMANGPEWGVPGQIRTNQVRFAERTAPDRAPAPREIPAIAFFSEKRGYAAARLKDVHAPGLPLLHPQNIRPGMSVEVVFARRDPSRPDAAVAEAFPAVVGKRSGDRPVWHFDATGKLPSVPPGAVVVDRESGLAVGIVPGTLRAGQVPGPVPGFVDFTHLYHNTNAVGLVPDPRRYTPEEQQPEPGTKRGGMIWVPGGAVEHSGMRSGLVQKMAGIGDGPACTPGFWIDERPVTNDEYRRFLEATGYKTRPPSWVAMDEAKYPRQGDLPVQGVRAQDAEAYAEWTGKRLVTPTEWQRASTGRLTSDWAKAYFAAQAMAKYQLFVAHREPNASRSLLLAPETIATLRNGMPPPIKLKSDFAGMDGAGGVFGSFVAPVEKHFGYPLVTLPAGIREGDRSEFGVLDVALNPHEILLGNLSDGGSWGGKTFLINATLRPDIFPQWPQILVLFYVHETLLTGTILGSDGFPLVPGFGAYYARRMRTETHPPTWRVLFGREHYHPFGWPLPWPPEEARRWGINGATFRCAR